MRRRRPHPLTLAAVGGLFLLAACLAYLLVGRSRGHRSAPAPPPTTTLPSTSLPTTTAPAPAPPPTTTVSTTTTSAPTPVPFSWREAGGLVAHMDAIDPTLLGHEMRAAGFGWVAVFLGDGPAVTTPDSSWIARFRAASGMAVGGWSVLRDDPAGEANAAAAAISAAGLQFYVADAEAEYAYTQGSVQVPADYDRSRQFVQAFRAAEPTLPAGLSSYCRPDQHDLDWGAWARAGFAFLPQAYVEDFGGNASPAACTAGAAHWFPRADVHPTIGSYLGVDGPVAPARYVELLDQAGTRGFSIYPAEVALDDADWQTYGAAVAAGRIATPAP